MASKHKMFIHKYGWTYKVYVGNDTNKHLFCKVNLRRGSWGNFKADINFISDKHYTLKAIDMLSIKVKKILNRANSNKYKTMRV
jgi:hypothetical protein